MSTAVYYLVRTFHLLVEGEGGADEVLITCKDFPSPYKNQPTRLRPHHFRQNLTSEGWHVAYSGFISPTL